MLSTVLSNLLSTTEQEGSPEIQKAVRDARKILEVKAKGSPCKRCEKAGWIFTFGKAPTGGFHEFSFFLSKCAGGVILQQNNDCIGLQMPTAPFFCSAKDEDGGHAGAGGPFKRAKTSSSGETQNDGWPSQRGG